MNTSNKQPLSSEQSLPTELNDMPQCACSHIDKLKSRITEFHMLVNIILTLDLPAYQREKQQCDVTHAFDKTFVKPMYRNLISVAELVNYHTLERLKGLTERDSDTGEIKMTRTEMAEMLVIRGVAAACQIFQNLMEILDHLQQRDQIPVAMTGNRLARIQEAVDIVWSIHEGSQKVTRLLCIYHTFYKEEDPSDEPEHRPSASSISGTENDIHVSRVDFIASCDICEGTLISTADDVNGSLLDLLNEDRFLEVKFRAWGATDPSGNQEEASRSYCDIAVNPGCAWLEATVESQTGKYSMAYGRADEEEAKFHEQHSEEEFHDFMRHVPRGLRKTLQRYLGHQEHKLSRWAPEGSSCVMLSALSKICDIIQGTESPSQSVGTISDSASMCLSEEEESPN